MNNAQQTSKLPLHKQVEDTVKKWITSGRYNAGDQLPPAREISDICKVKEQTVRRALKRLIDNGVLRGAQGKGVFVSKTGGKHMRIALVLPNLEDELTVLIAGGAQQIFEKSGIHTLILDARRDSAQENIHIANLPQLPVDGAIIFPIAHGNISERIVQLKSAGFPIVLVDKYLPFINIDCVLADDYGGTYALTSTLIELGYQRLVWLSGEEGASTVEDRLEGFRWALGNKGLPVSREQVRRLRLPTPTSDSQSRFEEELSTLINQPESLRPQVIVCANDLLALTAINYLQSKGIKVPADIAVTGFDNSKAAATASPSLTTVGKPSEEIGRKAAELLLRRMLNKTADPERIVLPASPIFRDSTRQPALVPSLV